MRIVISTAVFLIFVCGVCLGDRRDPPLEQTPLVVFTEHTDKIMSAAFSPDGRMLAIANVIYDPRNGEEIQTLPYDYDVGAWFLPVEWSPDGSKLLIVSLQTQAEVWDVSDLNTSVSDWRERASGE